MHFLMYCRKLELIMTNIKLLKSLPKTMYYSTGYMYMYFIINGSYFITFSDAYTCTCSKF